MLHIICQRPFRILGGGAWLLFCFINLLRTIRLIASIEMLVPRRLLIIRLEAMAFDSINNCSRGVWRTRTLLALFG